MGAFSAQESFKIAPVNFIKGNFIKGNFIKGNFIKGNFDRHFGRGRGVHGKLSVDRHGCLIEGPLYSFIIFNVYC